MPNTCVKLYQNWIINEVARVMTKGEHTYVRTYIRAYGTDPIAPQQLFLCEGIITGNQLPVHFYRYFLRAPVIIFRNHAQYVTKKTCIAFGHIALKP